MHGPTERRRIPQQVDVVVVVALVKAKACPDTRRRAAGGDLRRVPWRYEHNLIDKYSSATLGEEELPHE